MNDPKMHRETIFVSIASYRDSDCQYTIKDMFEKAAHPERITAGVLWQIDEEKDQHCFQVPYPCPEQVREIKVSHLDTGGVGWARAKTLSMHAGEDFILQIDAHSRFYPRWDDLIIESFKALQANGSKKPVITQWAPNIPEQGAPDWTTVHVLSAFIETDCLRSHPRMVFPIREPAPMTFLSAHCLFSSAEFFRKVPIDPRAIFTMEEFSIALRAWTHGWDVYTLPSSLIAHRFKTDCKPEYKSTLWQDKPDLHSGLVMDTRRYRHLIGKELSGDPDAIKDLDQYGLGSERTLKSFEQFSGVNLAMNRTEIFTDMGLAGKERILPAGCGALPAMGGPDKAAAAVSATAMQRLLNLLADMHITTVMDIGCMLPGLMRAYTHLQMYTGLHTDEALLGRLAAVHEHDPRFYFFKCFTNIAALPRTDAVVLDVGRISEDDCWYLFDLIKKTGDRYLLAPYQPDKNELTEAPFWFPEPEQILKCGRQLLGIWPIYGLKRRFLYKEPQLIRKLRTPLIAQLEQDLILIKKAVVPKWNFGVFLKQWSKNWDQNNAELKSSGMEQYFIDHNLLEKRNMLFRLLYICEYDRFLPEYSQFVTKDPYIRHIQSYLTCEALYDFAAWHGIWLKFGGNANDTFNFPLGNPPVDAGSQRRARALSDNDFGPPDNARAGRKRQKQIKNANKNKTIYMCYKHKNIPSKVVNNWKSLNPDWNVELYDHDECSRFLHKYYPEKGKLYDNIKHGPIKADLWRVCILHKYGGVYSDIDQEPLVSLEMMGINNNEIRMATCISFYNNFWEKGNDIAQAFIYSPKPGNQILSISADITCELWEKLPNRDEYWALSGVQTLSKAFEKVVKAKHLHIGYNSLDRILMFKEKGPAHLTHHAQDPHKLFIIDEDGRKIIKSKYDDWIGTGDNPDSGFDPNIGACQDSCHIRLN